MKALISNIQKFCVYDGPGIRTVVFFMGCPLRCKWCQNPENLSAEIKITFNQENCVLCGACIQCCPANANIIKKDARGNMHLAFLRNKCINCKKCIDVCRFSARDIYGKYMTVDEVFNEIIKDEVFYKRTGGGVTLSGGECTVFPEFSLELLKKAKEKSIHTAIETCGFCKTDIICKLAEYTDLFLYDFKAFSIDIHKKWIGSDNALIKKNLETLLSLEKHIIIRIPLIPEVNTGVELEKMAEYLHRLKGISEIHILPFHQVGSYKYDLIDEHYDMRNIKECSYDTAEEAEKSLTKYGFKVNIGGWDA